MTLNERNWVAKRTGPCPGLLVAPCPLHHSIQPEEVPPVQYPPAHGGGQKKTGSSARSLTHSTQLMDRREPVLLHMGMASCRVSEPCWPRSARTPARGEAGAAAGWSAKERVSGPACTSGAEGWSPSQGQPLGSPGCHRCVGGSPQPGAPQPRWVPHHAWTQAHRGEVSGSILAVVLIYIPNIPLVPFFFFSANPSHTIS